MEGLAWPRSEGPPGRALRARLCFASPTCAQSSARDARQSLAAVRYQAEPGNENNASCLVRFDYSHRDFVVAEVVAADANSVNGFDLNSCVFLCWHDQQWRLIDWRDA